jgi:internalin A
MVAGGAANMESYTSDSSDSESSLKTLDFSYLMLNRQTLHEHLECASSPEQVETLLLHQNRLSYLPESVLRFANLATLDVSNCGLRRLPDFLLQLDQLVCVSAKNNSITNDSLPKSLEGWPSLRELNLSGNALTEFPEQVLDLPGLRYLYLGGNRISEITEDVWKIQR